MVEIEDRYASLDIKGGMDRGKTIKNRWSTSAIVLTKSLFASLRSLLVIESFPNDITSSQAKKMLERRRVKGFLFFFEARRLSKRGGERLLGNVSFRT